MEAWIVILAILVLGYPDVAKWAFVSVAFFHYLNRR